MSANCQPRYVGEGRARRSAQIVLRAAPGSARRSRRSFNFTCGHSSPKSIAMRAPKLLGGLKLFSDLGGRRADNRRGSLGRAMPGFGRAHQLGALPSRSRHRCRASACVAMASSILALRRGTLGDQFPQNDIAHGEAERRQRDRPITELLNQIVVAAAPRERAQFAAAIECFEDDTGIIGKAAHDPEIDLYKLGQATLLRPARSRSNFSLLPPPSRIWKTGSARAPSRGAFSRAAHARSCRSPATFPAIVLPAHCALGESRSRIRGR